MVGNLGGDGSTIAVTGDTVYVSDYNTNRIIGFNQPPSGPTSTPDFVIGAPDIQTNTLKDNHFISNGIPLSLESGGLIIGDGMNTRLLCWDETPQSSGQTPDQVIDIQDEVIALAEHDGTIVVAGKWDGLKIWENGTPCDGNPANKTFHNTVGSIDTANLQSIAYDKKYFYLLDGNGILHVWKDIPSEGDEPKFSRELDTFEGILYSDGKYLSISGMDAFTFVKVSKLSEDGALEKIQISDRPQMIGHGIITDGRVFISDLSQNQVLAWQDLDAAVAGDDPDAILGATSLDDTDPDKTKSGLFWPLRLEFDGERLWVGEYKFSGRVLSYQAE